MKLISLLLIFLYSSSVFCQTEVIAVVDTIVPRETILNEEEQKFYDEIKREADSFNRIMEENQDPGAWPVGVETYNSFPFFSPTLIYLLVGIVLVGLVIIFIIMRRRKKK